MGNCCKLQRGASSWVDDDEWEVEDGKAVAAVEKTERVEVKIRVTRRQLQELLEKAGQGGKGRSAETESMLAELINSGMVCYHQQETRCHWRPSLQTIAEAEETCQDRDFSSSFSGVMACAPDLVNSRTSPSRAR